MNLFGTKKKKSNTRPKQQNNAAIGRNPQAQTRRPVQDNRNIQRNPQAPSSIPQRSSAPAAAKKKKGFDFTAPEKFDFSFFVVVVILLVFGLVMLFSATYASAKYETGDSFYYFNRQIVFAIAGFVGMIFLSFFDYHIIVNRKIVTLAKFIVWGMLAFVLVFGTSAGGSGRWIAIGDVITIQPSEFLKVVVIMIIAEYIQRKGDGIRDFKKGLLPLLITLAISCGLIILQPHISCTLIIGIICLTLLFVGKVDGKQLLALILIVIAFGLFIVLVIFPAIGYTYVENRIQSFLNPESDIGGNTLQTYQSLITIGSGGFFGQGLGNSHQKYSYLPVAENDFIFSVICEELGFVGAALIILLYVILVVRGFYIAASAPDKSGMLLCAGIVTHIGIQALMNIAVATNAMPNTGVSLPFISYGGTALIVQLCEMGIVLNISRKAAID